MNGLLFLFSCTCALFYGADSNILDETALTTQPGGSSASPAHVTSAAGVTFETSASTSSGSRSTTRSPCPKHTIATTSVPTTTWMTYRKECLTLYIVSGGLIILCIILLVCTVMLTWKVWQLSAHLKSLGSNGDLISNSEYWMGTARKNKGKEAGEAKETSMLLADCRQTQEAAGDTAATEQAGKANKDEQTGGEKKKEAGDAANREKVTPVTAAENSSSTKPQEDKTDAPSGNAAAASSSSEATEEPKDGV